MAEIQQVETDADEAHYPSSRGLLNSIHSEAESGVISLQKLAELQFANESDEEEKHPASYSKLANTDRKEWYLEYSTYMSIGYSIREILFPFHSFL